MNVDMHNRYSRHYSRSIIYIALILYIAMCMLIVERMHQLNKKQWKNVFNQNNVETDTITKVINIHHSNHHHRDEKNATETLHFWNKEAMVSLISKFTDIKHFCGDKIRLYGQSIILFTNVTVFPSLSSTRGKPGINPTDVPNQREEFEEYTFKRGFFSMDCELSSLAIFNSIAKNDIYKTWAGAFDLQSRINRTLLKKSESKLTVILKRSEYANVYWTLMDLYDVFLTAVFFNQSAFEINILLMDARPKGHLDSFWKIFNSVKRPCNLDGAVLYEKLNWLFPREKSPFLTKTLKKLPMLEEFRQFVFAANRVNYQHNRLCDKLNINFIWRRNYIAHPRNPSGLVSRKIRNEDQLLEQVKQVFPKHVINGYQLDLYNISEQLRVLAKTDVLIGMHGAGMSFSLFLPNHSAVIEMFPAYYRTYNWHMEFLARRSGHEYLKWRNSNYALEDTKLMYTIVPPTVIVKLIHRAETQMCS